MIATRSPGSMPLRHQPVREARGVLGDLAVAQDLVAAVGLDDDDGRPIAVDMPVDAFVRDVQPLAVAVEQLPQPGGREMRLGIGVARVGREARHGGRRSAKSAVVVQKNL